MSVTPSAIPLKDVTRHKEKGIYPSFVHYRVPIDPGEEISAILTIPDGYVYIRFPGRFTIVPSGCF